MKYHIISIGCQMNRADSERISTRLEELGYKWTDEKYQADLVVITTCGVRQSAEDRIYGFVPRIKKENKKVKIIIAGCLSEREDVIKRLDNQVALWLPARKIPDLAKMLTEVTEKTNDVDPCEYLKIKPKYNSKFSALIPIGNGCNNFCAYCVVPYARGREVYRNADEIITEVKDLIKKGYKEITLIAQNVNSYVSEVTKNKKQDTNKSQIINSKKINFSKLLVLINDIPGDFWIRFSTSHPKDMSDELIEVMNSCEKICEYIHLPAQAGDNEVLKNMNRKYTIEHYKGLIAKIRNKIPGITVSTDIIVGFPGETKEQFNNSVRLFEEIKYDLAYISQYSPRYGTKAVKMVDNVSGEEKKRREEILEKLLRKIAKEKNKEYIDKEVKILVEGKDRNDFWHGKTRSFKKVRIKSNEKDLIGKFIKVKITSADVFSLEGEII